MNGTETPKDISPISVVFPLPFQILALVGVQILGWATNLHGLDAAGIDVITSLDIRTDVSHPLPAHLSTPRQSSVLIGLYRSVYRIFILYSSLCFTAWLAWRYTSHGDVGLVDAFGYIPGIACLSIVCALFCPYNILHRPERRKLLHAIRRCLFASSDSPIYFTDVILADIFTSFAQVVGDVWLSLGMLIPGHSILKPYYGAGISRWILPTVMSFPYLVRLRQCVIEYNHQGNVHRRPLYNALKYASAFPAIYLSAVQGLAPEGDGSTVSNTWYGGSHIFQLWLLFAMVNSLYSFWWDITNDWGMVLLQLSPEVEPQTQESSLSSKRPSTPRLHSATPLVMRRNSASNLSEEALQLDTQYDMEVSNRRRNNDTPPFGLRNLLHFPVPVYMFLIALNLVLRLTWSMKLFSVVNVSSHAGIVNFSLKTAELFRRWVWVFIRVEWEMIKKGRESYMKIRVDENAAEYEMIPSATLERS